MVNLQIPDELQDSFILLGLIDNESFEKLVRTLNEVGPSTSSTSLISSVSAKFDGEVLPKVVTILDAVTALDEYRSVADLEVEDIIKDSYQSILDFNLVKTEEEAQRICERLRRLIDINSSIAITSKTSDLSNDYERIFLQSRIINDARPVFGQDGLEKPKGMLITHTLKIIYRDIEGNKEIYLSLDIEDIEQMYNQIGRAIKKTNSLVKMFKDLGVSCYITDEEGS
jgi:hypothetical protein